MLVVSVVLLWAIGVLTALTLGGLLHLLLVVAAALTALQLWRRARRRRDTAQPLGRI